MKTVDEVHYKKRLVENAEAILEAALQSYNDTADAYNRVNMKQSNPDRCSYIKALASTNNIYVHINTTDVETVYSKNSLVRKLKTTRSKKIVNTV